MKMTLVKEDKSLTCGRETGLICLIGHHCVAGGGREAEAGALHLQASSVHA